jgi:hypothetical protein
VGRPRLLGFKHRVVQSHQEQHQAAALPLLPERLLDFTFHPHAMEASDSTKALAPARSGVKRSGMAAP